MKQKEPLGCDVDLMLMKRKVRGSRMRDTQTVMQIGQPT